MASLIERPQWNVGTFPNPNMTAGLLTQNQEIQLDSDAPFRATGVAVYIVGATSADSNVLLRFTRPDGSWQHRLLTSGQAVNPFNTGSPVGAASQTAPYFTYFTPISPNLLYPAGSSIVIDFEDLTGTNVLALVVFIGTKIFREGQVWSPGYPAKYRALPYFGYSVQIPPTALPVYDMAFDIAPDADFVWQAGSQTDQHGDGLEPGWDRARAWHSDKGLGWEVLHERFRPRRADLRLR